MANNTLKEDGKNYPSRLAKSGNQTLPLNYILYGPPGTGKTYRALRLALAQMQSPNQQGEIPEKQVAQELSYYQEEGQLLILSFHPSFSYEDFIQGLKPNPESGKLLFEKQDGAFKKIADRARQNYDLFTRQQGESSLPFQELLNMFLSQAINPETEEIEVPLSREHRIYQSIIIYDILEDALIYHRRTKNDIIKSEKRSLSLKKLHALYQGQNIREAINEKYYQALVQALRQYERQLGSSESARELKNFVLLIDEINRADLSSVFGELLSLLEADKRYQAPSEMVLELASGDRFSVPPNLFIIGTMNTADMSTATLDLALRRRFHFEACYPRPELVDDQKLRRVLEKLNAALYREKNSAEFLIGHSFFMYQTWEEKNRVFNQQIIPLLSEFFPQRKEKVRQILEDAGLTVEENHYRLEII